jgi:hypothetical protein
VSSVLPLRHGARRDSHRCGSAPAGSPAPSRDTSPGNRALAIALVTGRAFWAPLAMLVGAGLFVLLYAYLLQLAVRRAREVAGELAPGHERDVSDR